MWFRRSLLGLVLAVSAAAGGAAMAQDEAGGVAAAPMAERKLGGLYMGARFIGSFGEMHSVKDRGFRGAGDVENDTDEVAGGAGVIGWRFHNFPARVEVEAGHRVRFDLDVRDIGPPLIDYEVDVGTTQVIINAVVEWRNSSSFTPFVGFSTGWAQHQASTQRTNLATQVQRKDQNDEDNLVFGGLVGVNWRFAQNWSAEFMYRYINMGEVSTGNLTFGEKIESDDYTSHDLLFSAYYHF